MSVLAEQLTKAKTRGKLKKKKVDLGAKGSFTIKHPGVTKAKAVAAGQTTREWAEAHQHDSGIWGVRARSALGLMKMNKG